MEMAFGLLVMLWALLGGGRSRGGGGGGGGSPGPIDRNEGPDASRALPPGGGVTVSTPPWPAVIPTGLPPFPGSGWEYDEPPPAAVQKRAGELVKSLWAKGLGTKKIEQTAGRWIAYQAGITAGNKHGVIASRLKRAAALPPGRAPAARPPAARPPAARPAPAQGMPPGSVRVTVDPATDIRPAASPLGLPVLRFGRGLKPALPDKDVVLLQQKLGIAADGRFGNDTRTAVSNFQAKQVNAQRPGWSLTDIDGVVGPQTWTALFAVRA